MKLYINWNTKQKVITGEKGFTKYDSTTTALKDRGFTFAGHIQGAYAQFDDTFIILENILDVKEFEKNYPLTQKARITLLEKRLSVFKL